VIRFEGVSKRFRRHEVLSDIHLSIEKGDRIAMVGSNGAGKTTLIRCLLGEYQYSGKLTVDGQHPRLQRTQVLKRIGFVPQLPPPLKMQVAQLIRFSAGVCDTEPERMISTAEILGLDIDKVKKQAFNKLSGGQKQKLLISIALGRDCDILVLDEPAANLDPEARSAFFQILSVRKQNSAMIISSHRLDEVAALVNRVVELDQGRIVLNDHVDDEVDMSSKLACRLVTKRRNEAFSAVIQDWGFEDGGDGLLWIGQIPGPDRLRLLGVLSRYAALLKEIHLEESAVVELERASA